MGKFKANIEKNRRELASQLSDSKLRKTYKNKKGNRVMYYSTKGFSGKKKVIKTRSSNGQFRTLVVSRTYKIGN